MSTGMRMTTIINTNMTSRWPPALVTVIRIAMRPSLTATFIFPMCTTAIAIRERQEILPQDQRRIMSGIVGGVEQDNF